MKAGARYWLMLAVLLAAATGMALLSHGESTPPARPLSQFPAQIDDYRAVADLPLEDRIVDLLGVTDYLNRVYQSPTGAIAGLYIGYFRTQRTGASIHSPKNCLPGAGWQPVTSQVYSLPVAGGGSVPINLYIIRKGLEAQVVLYWYQSHGRVVASEYWGKYYMVYDALRLNRTDAALVRITVPIAGGNEAAAQEQALSFARQITGDVAAFIPQ